MTIRYELQLLAASLTVGICLMMVYDGLRLFRTLMATVEQPISEQSPLMLRVRTSTKLLRAEQLQALPMTVPQQPVKR